MVERIVRRSRAKHNRVYIPEFFIDEQIRPVLGMPKYYVSESGKVYRAFEGFGWTFYRPVKARITRGGYYCVGLSMVPPGGRKTCFTKFVHRLVAEAFIGPPKAGEVVVRHLNGVRTHNHFTNLAWGSVRDNVLDAVRHGTLVRGERAAKAKLTERAVKDIRHRLSEGEKMSVLAKEHGIRRDSVRAIRDRRTWKHVL